MIFNKIISFLHEEVGEWLKAIDYKLPEIRSNPRNFKQNIEKQLSYRILLFLHCLVVSIFT